MTAGLLRLFQLLQFSKKTPEGVHVLLGKTSDNVVSVRCQTAYIAA